MSPLAWLLVSLAFFVLLYGVAVAVLLLVGRRADARALASFILDCVVFVGRLLRDPRVPTSRKAALVFLAGYLALPIDLIPDFIPIAGQLDDAIVTALVFRFVLRGGGPELLVEHWPGPPEGRRVIARLAYGRRSAVDAGPTRVF